MGPFPVAGNGPNGLSCCYYYYYIPKRRATINNPSWINNDVKQAIGRRQRADETKRRTNNKETVAEYIEAKRQVKRIVKQEKPNK